MESTLRLHKLVEQLRLYKAPSPPEGDDVEADSGRTPSAAVAAATLTREEGLFPVGLTESAGSDVPRQDMFRSKRAAVLICLFEGEHGEFRVFLTKRSSKLSTHSGEVALPGGKADEEDKDDADTATREAKEEIGLDPSLVTVVAVLEPFLSKHLLRVVPVIGILSNKQEFKPVANACEVEAIFDAPLEMFLKDQNRRFEEREWMGEKYVVHYFDFETENENFVIWGMTAGILIRAASIVYERPPSFPEQKPNFRVPRYLNDNTVMP